MNAQKETAQGRQAAMALALVNAGWLLFACAILRNFGDANPMTSRAEMVAARGISVGFALFGVGALTAAVWLSGRTFEGARTRAAVALVLFVVPTLALFALAFFANY